jgi:hypothetical protein
MLVYIDIFHIKGYNVGKIPKEWTEATYKSKKRGERSHYI